MFSTCPTATLNMFQTSTLTLDLFHNQIWTISWSDSLDIAWSSYEKGALQIFCIVGAFQNLTGQQFTLVMEAASCPFSAKVGTCIVQTRVVNWKLF